MKPLSTELRNQLAKAIASARRTAEAGARNALETLAVHLREAHSTMSKAERELRNRLRAHGRQLGDERDTRGGTQEIARLVHECAYEHWHRMLFARFLAENGLLLEPEHQVAVTLEECAELARTTREDPWAIASRFAQRMLPQIFRPDDPVLEVSLPAESRQALERLVSALPVEIFTADDSLGWTYQFWQAEKKDEVNKSGRKIGADEIAAVTQLFTEHYMVLFLLDNTIGAWHAGKVLAKSRELAPSAEGEDVLRRACALPDYEWEYLRFVQEDKGPWRPAAGMFDGWPKTAKEITVLDPCCGSGHFLTAAFECLVRLRMHEEDLSKEAAAKAVIADNIHGLEIDARCTQIAAFALAFAAWKFVGRVIPLPALKIACSGLSTGVDKNEWVKLAGKDARLRAGMERLYDLFEQAPMLGSLVDPSALAGDLIEAGFKELKSLFDRAVATTTDDIEKHEVAVTASGLAQAAELLASRFTLVATNVPYLKRGKQLPPLQEHCGRFHDDAKGNLGCTFVDRCLRMTQASGTTAVVVINEMLFLKTYTGIRKRLLNDMEWNLAIRLGPGAFETISGEVVNVALLGITLRQGKEGNFAGVDVSDSRDASEKARALALRVPKVIAQAAQIKNPDARIVVGDLDHQHRLLSAFAIPGKGSTTGDSPHYHRCFWEFPVFPRNAVPWLDSPIDGDLWSGRHLLSIVGVEDPRLLQENGCMIRGQQLWHRHGVAVSKMTELRPFVYAGEVFDDNVGVLCPNDPSLIPAILAYCMSDEYAADIREIDQALKVTAATLAKVPFDVERWKEAARGLYPHGVPSPVSLDPRQWLFKGHPERSAEPLQVALARLVGFQWPQQTGSSFPDSPTLGPDGLETFSDDDGVVCLSSIRGEEPAVDRLRRLLAAAFGSEWSPAKERELIQATGSEAESLADWLRDDFFRQHCALFHHRPFIWHIWDGRKDGFNVLVNYHRLAAPNGAGRKLLEKMAHTYLGDWIDRQRAEQREGRGGADARLAAAQALRPELEKILEGDPPYDLFIRWKPLSEQPIGWEPDINDGVRLNIRPFMLAKDLGRKGAGILRDKPNISWSKDRGTEPKQGRSKEAFPWFWDCDPENEPQHQRDFLGGRDFTGERWNDLHYSLAIKRQARTQGVHAGGGRR